MPVRFPIGMVFVATACSRIFCAFARMRSGVSSRRFFGATANPTCVGFSAWQPVQRAWMIDCTTASRWVPVLGAAAVGSYAYWDTLQVAKTARRLLVMPTSPTPDS